MKKKEMESADNPIAAEVGVRKAVSSVRAFEARIGQYMEYINDK
jgi:hypothetical protein